MTNLNKILLPLLFGTVSLPVMADTILTDSDLAGAYTVKTYTKRVVCHDPSIFMDTVTNGTKSAPQYYIYGSHLGRGKTSADVNYRDWTNFKTGEENTGTANSLFASVNGSPVNYSNAYSTHKITTVRNFEGKEVQFGNFDAHQWQNSGYQVRGNQWAADAIWNKKMQKWCLYMSLNGDKWCSCIVCFTSSTPEGPWIYQGPVVFSGFNGATAHVGYSKTDDYKKMDLEIAIGTQDKLPQRYAPSQNYGQVWPNCIDPCVFYDEEGKLWMSYGSWSGGIFILRLNEENGLRDYEYKFPYEISGKEATPGAANNACTCDPYFGRKIAGGYYVSGEASYIEYVNGYYYLFMSYGGLEAAGGYQMRVFRSEKPDGPYTDCLTANGQNAIYTSYQLNFGSDAKVDKGQKIFGQYQWDPMATAELAQGHNSAIVDHEGRALLVYHTRFNNGTEGHQVRVHQMFQNQDGWLCAAPYEFNGETVNTVQACTQQYVNADEMVGDYQIMMHNYRQNTKSKAYESPVNVSLNEDGTVTGTYTGTWALVSGTSFIDLTLKGVRTAQQNVTFRGVVVRQTIDYTNIPAICITAISSSDGQSTASNASIQTRGLSLWASKAETKAAIKYSIDKMSVGFYNNSTISKNLNLPTQSKLGTNVSWSSSDTNILTNEGKVVGNGDVTMTMFLTKDGYCYEKNYKLHVDASAVPTVPVYYPESQSKNTTAGWWQNFSDYYELPAGESCQFKFKNYSNMQENWKNWVLYAANGDRGASGWVEYFGIRCDNWNNTTGSNAGCSCDFNWDTFKQDMNGSTVDMTVSYMSNRPKMECTITTNSGVEYHLSYTHTTNVTVPKLTLFFCSEGSYITGAELGIEQIAADTEATDTHNFDIFGRRLSQPINGIQVMGGRKVIIR